MKMSKSVGCVALACVLLRALAFLYLRFFLDILM